MKSKILKTSVVILLIMTLTMVNFITIGNSFVSYASEDISTNHKNVEFRAGFEDENGNLTQNIESAKSQEEMTLWLQVNVKNEGYLNGQISIENSNFTLKETESSYVNRIEENTIYLNQINAGTTADIKIKIEPIQNEEYEIGLLNRATQVSISGIYRDSTEKDINIRATRTINLKMTQNVNKDNLQNDVQVITNKITKIDGEEKRVVQFLWTMGLKENTYPEKETTGKMELPVINEEIPEVKTITKLNNMTKSNIEVNENVVTVDLKNPETEDGKVMWKSEGTEEIIVTAIYDKSAEIGAGEVSIEQNITFYDNSSISGNARKTLSNEELDQIINITSENSESEIYKGKIYSGIDRTYSDNIKLDVNLADAVQEVEIIEEMPSFVSDNSRDVANVVINKTSVNKENMKNILGENGTITIYNAEGNRIALISQTNEADENGNIVLNYNENESANIRMVTSKPVAEGTLEINNEKTIKESNQDIVRNANTLETRITAEYNKQDTVTFAKGTLKESTTKTELKNSQTEASFELNKNTLSTIVDNDLEMKIVLKSNDEKYDLYQNPNLVITLPEQVQNITINSIDMLYETDLKIANYRVEGRNIILTLEGKQSGYKDRAIDGTNIIINATIEVNPKSATSNENIVLRYNNQNAVSYVDGNEQGTVSSQIQIVAPKDVTAVHSISDLSIETLGQEESTTVTLPKAQGVRNVTADIEVINNNQEEIQNVRILGTFPTNNNENNMGITLNSGITLGEGIQGTVYYSNNENATNDLENSENGWKQDLNLNEAKKYLIIIDNVQGQSSVIANYGITIPENLEYNQNASLGYTVNYGNTLTRMENQINATTIELQTGVGPKIDTNLVASVAGNQDTGTVKNGEVIKYRVEISNTGTEDISNITVEGEVPEGATLVEPEENYEYTGAGYYKELEDRTYSETIENLKVGETTSVEYEVRVNSDTSEGTELRTKARVNYQEAVQETNEVVTRTESGNLRVSVKKVTGRDSNLYETGVVQYFAIIENISNDTQENVTVRTNKSDILNVERLILFTGMEHNEVSDDELISPSSISQIEGLEETSQNSNSEENLVSEEIEYSDEINIGTLNPGETKVLSYDMSINNVENEESIITFAVTAKDAEKEYRSNSLEDTVREFDVSMEMTSNTESRYIKSGDQVNYTITVRNNTNTYLEGINITDSIPDALTVNRVTIDGQDMGEINGNNLTMTCNIEANGETTIVIETVVNYSAGRTEAESITNIAYAEVFGERIANTQEVSHIIEADEQSGNNGNGGNNSGNSGNNGSDIANGENIITGIAWFDENVNGRKDENESTLSGINVMLLNVSTNNLVRDENGEVLEVATNDNGVYILNNISQGQYIAIFDYDTSIYNLTTYKAQGVSEDENSDVLMSNLSVNSEQEEVPATDIITINGENVDGINIGLTELKNFDLKLDKYVTKMIVQNDRGTTQTEYDNETTAKVEIDARNLSSSTVIIEYKIVVTNVGDTPGYARSIVDYVSKDLSFSSELNKDWYSQGDYLYSSSLANEEILPGESKELTLTLTKAMTEDNTGLVPNTAEIAESYNEQGLQDSNSTPGNNTKGENDQGSADAIISIRTGAIVYTGIVIGIIAILCVIAVVIIRLKNKKGDK